MSNCIQFPYEYAKIKNIFNKIKIATFAIRDGSWTKKNGCHFLKKPMS